MGDLYATSPSNSDVSIFSASSCNTDDLYITTHDKKQNKKKKKNRNKDKYNQYIREETNIFEVFNKNDYYDYSNNNKNNYNNSNTELLPRNEIQKNLLIY